MECEQIEHLLAVSPREWNEAERAQVTSHVQTCAGCAAVARRYAEQERLLSALPRPGLAPARQQAILAQARRESSGVRLRSHLAGVLSAAAGVLFFGLLAVMLVWSLRNPTPAGPTTNLIGMSTLTATPLTSIVKFPSPTAAPPPTVVLPNGQFATATPYTPSPAYATQEAARQATETARQATVVARATVFPFPTAGPVTVQPGEPAIAFARRGGLSLQVRLAKDTFMAGEGRQAEVTLRNDTPETIYVQDLTSMLRDEQGQSPDPWPWEPMVFPGLRGRGVGKLSPGQVLTKTLAFYAPPTEPAGHAYALWTEITFSRMMPDQPEWPDDQWMRLGTGPIPLRIVPPDPTRQLTARLYVDLTGWKLQVTDAAGRVPPGPLWGRMEALCANTATDGPLQNSADGVWSATWIDTRQLQNTSQIAMRAWVAAPGYIIAIARIGSDARFDYSAPVR